MKFKMLANTVCFGLSLLLNGSLVTADQDLSGSWKGALGPVELTFHFENKTDSGWSGSVDTPQQNSYGLPANVIVKPEGTLTISVPATSATCDALLDVDSGKIQGTWNQGGISMPLKLNRTAPRTRLSAKLAAEVAGLYEGKAVIQLIQLRMILSLEVIEDTNVRGYLISTDQSPEEIPFDRFDQVAERRLRLCASSVFLTLDLILSEDGKELSGIMLQGPGKYPFKLERKEDVEKPQRPQTPQPPFPYQEFHWVGNKDSWCPIGATLTVPKGGGPFPVAILISGSGTQDRDSSLFGHHPFRVIADDLARKGIASIRYDDPGISESPPLENQNLATSFDYMKLAQTLYQLASEAEQHFQIKDENGAIADGVIGDSIGYLGHSEGAVIAQLIAALAEDEDQPNPSFIISLAGPGVRGDQLLLDQNRALSKAEGLDDATLDSALELNRKIFSAILEAPAASEQETTKDPVRARVESHATARIKDIIAADMKISEEDKARISAQVSIPWIRWFIRYDPEWAIKRIRTPHLLIFGKKDLQVPWDSNVERIQQLLKNPSLAEFDHEVRIFENLNHLFQNCETGTVSEYAKIEETISQEVLNTISEWILQRFDRQN